MKTLRLVTIIDTYPGVNGTICVGGPETNLDRLLKYISTNHWDEVRSTVFIHRGSLAPQTLELNHDSPQAKIIRTPRLRRLKNFLIRNQEQFDLLYFLDKTLYFRPHLFFSLLRNVNRPILLRVTSTKYLDFAKRVPPWMRRSLYRLLLKNRKNIFFLTLSEECTKGLKELGVSDEYIVRIPNAVDLFRHQGTTEITKREAMRTKLFPHLTSGHCVFVYVGRIIGWHKRVDHLLEAWKQSGLSESGHRLLLIGAPKRDVFITDGFRLWNRYGPKNGTSGEGRLNGTYWTGLLHISEIPQYLAASDVFVLPSDFEGMSNAAVEALASGLPIIGRKNVSGNSELIDPKKTGLFFESIDELSSALLWMSAAQNRQGMREACLERAQQFSVENMAKSYLQFFKKSHAEHRQLTA